MEGTISIEGTLLMLDDSTPPSMGWRITLSFVPTKRIETPYSFSATREKA
jgi:hypothetical protein